MTDDQIKCGRCRINIEEIVRKQEGMWLSFSTDPITGKVKFLEREEGPWLSRPRRHALPGRRTTGQSQAGSDDEEGVQSEHRGSWGSHGHVEL